MSALIFHQWDIWEVLWHHLDDGTSKPRPVLVISSDKYNAANNHFWGIKITSVPQRDPHVFEVTAFDPAFAVTGLKKTSYFCLNMAREIKKTDALHLRGHLGVMMQFALKQLIEKATGKSWD
ncbi:MAG TPA: type II toxin-antitoxin system PemK/MazF family toxin [Planctomycetota bacterium]|nr:type II toxin-antitoxin system PemK/MazF family toxin [Planctomycetota bacterium]